MNTDNQKLAVLGQFTPEGVLTPGYGDHYLFFVGRDDVHNIFLTLLGNEKLEFDFNMFGFDDEELNQLILDMLKNPSIIVQGTLDKSQSVGAHEKKLLEFDEANNPNFSNSIAIGESQTHQISHTKSGLLVGQGIAFEGSTNWSASGEGTGISLKADVKNPSCWKAQNNSLVVTANPIFIARLRTRLAIEHLIAKNQQSGGVV